MQNTRTGPKLDQTKKEGLKRHFLERLGHLIGLSAGSLSVLGNEMVTRSVFSTYSSLCDLGAAEEASEILHPKQLLAA